MEVVHVAVIISVCIWIDFVWIIGLLKNLKMLIRNTIC